MTIRLIDCQGHVEHEHEDDHADQAEHAGNQLAEAGGQDVGDVLHIVGQAAHQVAVGVLVEEAHRQSLQPGEQVRAHVAHGALGYPGHQVGLQPGARRADDVGDDHQTQQAGQAGQVALVDIGVDGQAHQVRARAGRRMW